MAGDNAVRLLLEKMTQCASSAYMSILERLLLFFLLSICRSSMASNCIYSFLLPDSISSVLLCMFGCSFLLALRLLIKNEGG